MRDHHLRIAAEHKLAQPDEKIGDAERRHEQDDVRLVDQRAQHQTLDCKRQHQHHHDGQSERDKRRYAVLMQAYQRKRSEHDHNALREIEYAGRLEDQDKAERDQSIEHAGDETVPQGLDQ